MSTSYWSIRNPWNLSVAIDEFGAGTLDSNPLDGGSFDACGPAAMENAIASYQARVPNYENIGAHRASMINAGQWTPDANGNPFPVSNPRTNGCRIVNIAAVLPLLNMDVLDFHDYTDWLITEQDIHNVLAHHAAATFIVTNAAALAGNEATVHNHFVSVTAYGGDNPDGSVGKLYILNSDIAGQHGVATGQWTPLAQFLSAEPHGYVVYGPTPPPPPVEAPEDENTAGATITLQQIQQYIDNAVATGMAQLKEPAGG